MARTVSPGEPIAPHLTAAWYNSTLRPPNKPPTPREKEGQHHNEHSATFIPGGGFTEAARFTPVGIHGPADSYDQHHVNRHCNVSKYNLGLYNWIVPQLDMKSGAYTQPCVYAGLTFASVTIRETSHNFVNLDEETSELVSDHYGKGMILSPDLGVSSEPQIILINIAGFIPTLKEIDVVKEVAIVGNNLRHYLATVKVHDFEFDHTNYIDIPLTDCEVEDAPDPA